MKFERKDSELMPQLFRVKCGITEMFGSQGRRGRKGTRKARGKTDHKMQQPQQHDDCEQPQDLCHLPEPWLMEVFTSPGTSGLSLSLALSESSTVSSWAALTANHTHHTHGVNF